MQVDSNWYHTACVMGTGKGRRFPNSMLKFRPRRTVYNVATEKESNLHKE